MNSGLQTGLPIVACFFLDGNGRGKRGATLRGKESDWGLVDILDDHYADEVGLLSQRRKYMEEKLNCLGEEAKKVDLKFNRTNIKTMKMNCRKGVFEFDG